MGRAYQSKGWAAFSFHCSCTAQLKSDEKSLLLEFPLHYFSTQLSSTKESGGLFFFFMAKTEITLKGAGIGIAVLLLSLSIVSFVTSNSDGDILLTIKDKWHANLPTWTSKTNFCGQWEGVTCNEHGNVVSLNLQNHLINSSLPDELSKLIYLTDLNLQGCSLWGGLSENFGGLSSIQNLDLSRNLLTGTIPNSWKNMKNLENLSLQYNYITKEFPPWLLDHENIKFVNLSLNQMFGSLQNISSNSLQVLDLSCNYYQVSSDIIPNATSYNGACFFNGSSWQDLSADNCIRTQSCAGFYKNKKGDCPQCPTNQGRINESLCICEEMGEKSSSAKKKSKTGLRIGVVLSLFGLLCVILTVVFKWKTAKNARPKGRNAFTVKDINEFWKVPEGVQRFSIEELTKATDNFDKDREIGAGGFGKVYFGILEDGRKIAIKCSSESSRQGSLEFHNEVILLSRLHHRNLVRLEGFCDHGEIQMLVYECVMNGNLHTWLFKNTSGYYFDWRKRLEIALDVAQGLEYLHSFADPPVIHRDVKASNILLDDHFNAKLSDFGLSQTNPTFRTHLSLIPAGTAGYIDPQYFIRHHLTTASDVYAYGVVLLELITGRKAIDNSRQEEENLIEWVKPRLCSNGIASIIDPHIEINYPKDIYYSLADLAMKCASFNKEDRPSMKVTLFMGRCQLQLSIFSTKYMSEAKKRKPEPSPP